MATLALEAEARRVGVSSSAYVRALVIINLTQRGENVCVRRSVLHTNIDRAVKRFTHQPTHTRTKLSELTVQFWMLAPLDPPPNETTTVTLSDALGKSTRELERAKSSKR